MQIRELEIASIAEKAFEWNENEAVVSRTDRIVSERCSFYIASNKTRPEIGYFAVTDEGTIITPTEKGAAQNILQKCGEDLSPGSWAEVVVNFSPGVGQGKVLHQAGDTPIVAMRGRKSADSFGFHPPAFTQPDKGVEFFLSPGPTSDQVLKVIARLDSGSLLIQKSAAAGK